jgi:serine protease Do
MKNRNKTLPGLIWFLVFVLLLLLTSVVFNRRGNVFKNSFSRISAVVKPLLQFKKYGESRSLLRQEVVQEESSIIDVVDNVSPSVVSVVVKTLDFDIFSGPSVSEAGIGTGFIVDPNGLIVTNSHVVSDSSGEYSVILKDGNTYEVNKVHFDTISDLAILEIAARNLPPVKLGDSDSLKVGQTAIAIGNALGEFQNTVTVGVISGVGRDVSAHGGAGEVKSYEGVIQTDAAVNPGNSGGPLLNSSGQVIGVNVATSIGAENISFAIPINDFKPLLENFLKSGKIQRPYLGVSYVIISKETATLRRLPEGAFIQQILPDSPAKKASLQRGDIITKIDGESISVKMSLSKIISKKKVGDRVSLTVDRGGSELTLYANLEEAAENPK